VKIVQRHIEERGLLNADQFGFRARHSTTLLRMRLTHYVTLNFNNNISPAAEYLGIEKPLTQYGTSVCYIICLN
jgi:hypothetical protein